jgi:hypothetical protein
VTAAMVANYARAAAIADLFVEAGVMSKECLTAINSAGRALRQLDLRLRELGLTPGVAIVDKTAEVERYVTDTYGNGDRS